MRRFFADSSFWNQPIPTSAETDPASTELLAFMHSRDPRGFWTNLHEWTIPIYEVDAITPRRRVFKKFKPEHGMIKRSEQYLTPDHPYGHGRLFAADAAAGLVPIPDYAMPDPASDAHIALVDWESGWIWDMWSSRRRPDGDWDANTGMKYRVDGSGVFDRSEFAVHNGESIHPYGPSRAAGVPALAGTIMHEEILAGRIEHKLGFATMAAALQRFVYPPACWTDGGWKRGLPEGATVQLDPSLDLESLSLSPAAKVIARALQEYGAVCVDVAGGHCLYGQGLYADPQKRTWEGLFDGHAVESIPLARYRVVKMERLVSEGQGPRKPDGMYAGDE